jgi:integrase
MGALDGVSPDRYIFVSRNGANRHICRSQAWRIIKKAAAALGIEGRISCHSLRKTFGYCAWQAKNSPVVIMEIYNHSSFKTTMRYIGVAQNDLDKVYLGLSLL